jgi:hypothetical protein
MSVFGTSIIEKKNYGQIDGRSICVVAQGIWSSRKGSSECVNLRKCPMDFDRLQELGTPTLFCSFVDMGYIEMILTITCISTYIPMVNMSYGFYI